MKKVVCAILAAVCVLCACKKQQASAPAATMVSAVKVIQQDLPWNIEYPAQVIGSLEVQIRAQVGGILQERFYNEGEFVNEGDLLFQIDDSEYKVALEKAQGSLAQAQAEEKRTYRTYQRMKTLRSSNAVSQQDYDNALSAYEMAQANVKVAKAAVEGAEINLGYTKVTAPISGIAGEAVPSVGSLISPTGETGYLTNMVQINPLYAKFSMPGSQFNRLAQGFTSGQIAFGRATPDKKIDNEAYRQQSAEEAAVYIEAVLPNGELYPQRGKIIFFDSGENAQTSSIAMKAEFANPQNTRLLMPGQFVRVHLVGATYKDAILIPSSAVLHTANELLVYVVDSNNTIEARPITGELQDDMYVVTSGLKADETVVSEGLSRVRAGDKVQVQLQPFAVEEKTSQTAPLADEKEMGQLEEAIEDSEAPDAQKLAQESLTSSVETSASTQTAAQAARAK